MMLEPQWWGDVPGTWAPGEILQAQPDSRSSDPVFQTTTGWFFCDETWTRCFGPHPSEEACRKSLEDYGEWLQTGLDQPTRQAIKLMRDLADKLEKHGTTLVATQQNRDVKMVVRSLGDPTDLEVGNTIYTTITLKEGFKVGEFFKGEGT